MKYELVECLNNNSVGIEFIGKVNFLQIERCFYFGALISSKLKSVVFENDIIIITTKNSTYKFKEVN